MELVRRNSKISLPSFFSAHALFSVKRSQREACFLGKSSSKFKTDDSTIKSLFNRLKVSDNVVLNKKSVCLDFSKSSSFPETKHCSRCFKGPLTLPLSITVPSTLYFFKGPKEFLSFSKAKEGVAMVKSV